jgi:hypothetical protein
MSKLTKALTAAAGNAAGDPLYVEDVFSTYLYTGTGSSLPIVNGIDLADSGGLVWTKRRTSANSNWFLDSERGGTQIIRSNTTEGQFTSAGLEITSFNSDGYTLGTANSINSTSQDDVSWTFRKAEKFFDVQTWTGNGVAGRTVAHNLGSTPAVIIIKATSISSNWAMYHASLGNTKYMQINAYVGAGITDSTFWNNTSPTDSVFTLGTSSLVNQSGVSYVAYIYASDAGGFGDDGTENIIKCGTFNSGSSGFSVDLGFEPQWILIKDLGGNQYTAIYDTMRGWVTFGNPNGNKHLYPSTSGAEGSYTTCGVESTGFKWQQYANTDYIYIAIRRPMKTPESGTEVFDVDTWGSGANPPSFLSNFPVDMMLFKNIANGTQSWRNSARLIQGKQLVTDTTAAETDASLNKFDYMDGWQDSTGTNTSIYSWMFKRATGFMDVVCYTSTTSAINHNLGVSPELVIYKSRTAGGWYTMVATDGFGELNGSGAWGGAGNGSGLGSNLANATATTITGAGNLYGSGVSMVTYLFATLAGVSKVGSYTGTGADLNVDCGFSAGARFVLIKRTDSTGDWYLWDTERGIVAGNDPYLLLNTTAAEVTSTDYIDPLSSGFTVTSSAPAALNASGGTYIFLAIA